MGLFSIMPVSHLFGIVIVAVLGAFVMDMVVTHNIIQQNHPQFWNYYVKIQFVPALLCMLLFYTLFSAIFNPVVGWILGVPFGIYAAAAFIQSYMAVFPIPGVSNIGLGFELSFKQGYSTTSFNYLTAFIATTLLIFVFNMFNSFPLSSKVRRESTATSWVATLVLLILTGLYMVIVWFTTPHVLYQGISNFQDIPTTMIF